MRKLEACVIPAAQKIYEEALSRWRAGELTQAGQAMEQFQRLDADSAYGWLLRAYMQRDQGELLSERMTLEQLLAGLPAANAASLRLLADAWSLFGAVQNALGQPVAARQAYQQAARLEVRPAQRLWEYSNAIFMENYLSGEMAESCRCLYADYQAALPVALPLAAKDYSHRQLRIGYLSADFRCHPVGYFAAALFAHFDAGRFAVYGYAANDADALTELFARQATVWRDVRGLAAETVAQRIREDEIDILVDLTGHTAHNLLPVLACRPAPVQLSGLGYMGTTGMAAVDYFLGDRFLEWGLARPPYPCLAVSPDFTERLLVLPHSHFCCSLLDRFPPAAAAPCLSRGTVTFGCFNNFAKVSDALLGLWAQILEQVPGSRLLLKHQLFDSAEGRAYIGQRLAAQGIPLARVELRGFSAGYLAEYQEVDVALDTYPYTGGMTTFEALYMGVPVVSLYGNRHGSRFGLSLLGNVGLEELAAATPAGYVVRAVGLARDKDLLAALHQKLRTLVQRSPLVDGAAYVHEMEAAYQLIWKERWQEHE